MVDGTKISEFPEDTPDLTDEIIVVKDLSGTPTNKKITIQALADLINGEAPDPDPDYVVPVISAFTNDINTAEVGASISSTVLDWTINKTVTSQSLNQTIGVIDAALRTYTDTNAYTTTRTYTLTINDGTTEVTANTTITFKNKRYWGFSASATLDDAGVLALNSEFATSRIQTRDNMAPSAEYIYFAWPTSFGTPTFIVNNFENNSFVLVTRAFVNASGGSVSFDIWRSNNALTGTYDLEVE